jgi:hypothetical protein
MLVSPCYYIPITHIFSFKFRTVTPPVVSYSPKECVEEPYYELPHSALRSLSEVRTEPW